jgi:NAD(P)-dependent dehydrogenase (short-subunit alcohol dehydrogenase family)
MFDLTHKIAVITGAGSGIGEAIARALAGAGALVYVADRNADAGQKVATSIGINARFVEIDVADAAACKHAAAGLLEAHAGRIDVLVNNAGIGHVGTTLTTAGEDMDRLWAVNVKGTLFMTQAFLPAMIARHAGSVIHMASIGGVVGVRDRLAYCATKSAIVGMTRCMALDHADTGVRFNCICPGRVETPWVQQRLTEYPDPAKAYREMAATQAIGRMGRPDEIAAAALYLAADESAFVTGSSLIIDGGWSAGKV